MPGTRVQVLLMTGLVRVSRGGGPGCGSWLIGSASRRRWFGGVACLRHDGEVSQLFADADAEVARLVEGGLGADRSPANRCIVPPYTMSDQHSSHGKTISDLN
jgi:hypothetical protein